MPYIFELNSRNILYKISVLLVFIEANTAELDALAPQRNKSTITPKINTLGVQKRFGTAPFEHGQCAEHACLSTGVGCYRD